MSASVAEAVRGLLDGWSRLTIRNLDRRTRHSQLRRQHSEAYLTRN
jgi:hypothetical protein